MSLGFHSVPFEIHRHHSTQRVTIPHAPVYSSAPDPTTTLEVVQHKRCAWVRFTGYVLIFVSLASFAAMTSLQTNVWTQSYWGGIKNSSYCEPPAPFSIREPINSWSNAAYLIVSFGIFRRLRHSEDVEVLKRQLFLATIALTFVGLAVSSFYFHASFVRGWRTADKAFTRATPIALFGYSLFRLTRGCVANVLFGATVIAQSLAFMWGSQPVFIVTISGLVCIELIVRPIRRWSSSQVWLLSATSLAVFGLSFAIRQLEVSGELCLFSVWFQPHSVWHIGTSVASALQIYAWRDDI